MPDGVYARPLRAAIRRQPTAILYRAVAGQAPAYPVTGLLSMQYDQIQGFGSAEAADAELRFEFVSSDLPVFAAQNAEIEFVSGGAHCRIADGTRLRVKTVKPDDGGCTLLVLGHKK